MKYWLLIFVMTCPVLSPPLVLDAQENHLAFRSSRSSYPAKRSEELWLQQQSQQDEEEPIPRSTPKKIVGGKKTGRVANRVAKGRSVPVIEAKLNGKGPFLFYFDSGAGTATLNKAFVEKLDLPTGKTTTIRGPGKGPGIKADIVSVAKFEIGGISMQDFEAASFDRSKFSGGEDLAGSIGLGVFGDLPVTIDFLNNKIIVGGNGLPKADGKTVLACDFDGPVPFFEIQLDKTKVNAAFDSGFAGSLLVGAKSAEKLKLKGSPSVIGKARSVSGEIEIKAATLDGSLQVGSLSSSNPKLTIMPEILSDREICVLGHAWGRELAVTYDRRNKRIRFQKPENKNEK